MLLTVSVKVLSYRSNIELYFDAQKVLLGGMYLRQNNLNLCWGGAFKALRGEMKLCIK